MSIRFNRSIVERYNFILKNIEPEITPKEVSEKFNLPLKAAEQNMKKLCDAGYLTSNKKKCEDGRWRIFYKAIKFDIEEDNIRQYEAYIAQNSNNNLKLIEGARFIAERHVQVALRSTGKVSIASCFSIL